MIDTSPEEDRSDWCGESPHFFIASSVARPAHRLDETPKKPRSEFIPPHYPELYNFVSIGTNMTAYFLDYTECIVG
jgi:hypothetical protein